MNKKGFEFSFGWIFAIIVGAAIIFMAIYFTTNLIKNERNAQDSEVGQQLSSLLTPYESGVESEKSSPPIVFPVKTRIITSCSNEGSLGKQSLSVATSSGIGEEFQGSGLPTEFQNKYIFQEKTIEGKGFNVFSKQFKLGFKVADLIFLWSQDKKYCFISPPRYLKEEIENLNLNINVSESVGKCPRESLKVCFSNSGCDIDVSFNPDRPEAGSVKKNKKIVYYEGALIYGAVFSEPDVYECQVKRLMRRAADLSLLYYDKSDKILSNDAGCSTNIQQDLINYASLARNLNSSLEIRQVYNAAVSAYDKNNAISSCKLWRESWDR